MLSLKKLTFGRRRSSRDNSMDLSSSLNTLEARLSEKTDLIDEMKKIVPLDVEAPGVILLGFAGSGKSTILEALTGVPLPRSAPCKAARKMLKIRINSDPTCAKTYALVSLTDPTCKDEKQIRRVNNMEDLPRVLAALQKKKLPAAGGPSIDYSDFPIEEEEEGQEGGMMGDEHSVHSVATSNTNSSTAAAEESRRRMLGTPFEAIYVRVLRPSGPTYNVIELPGLLPHTTTTSSSSGGREEEDEVRATYEGQLRQVLREHPAHLILALVEVPDLFDRAKSVQMAKSVDPESRRTLGVVTKMHLVEKDMDIVEKLQMTSRKDCLLPLGYVAIHAGTTITSSSSSSNNNSISNSLLLKPSSFPSTSAGWELALEGEKHFFLTNALLRGLKPERWGLLSLKNMVVNFQANAIAQRIPEMMFKVRQELDFLGGGKEGGLEGQGQGRKEGGGGEGGREVAVFGGMGGGGGDFFTKLCSETTSLAFDINELANGSKTRQDRKYNLGPRFLTAIDARESQARKILPSFCSPESETWLVKELEQFRGVVTSNDSLSHPIFKKAVSEVCFPVLRLYAKSVKDDTSHILKEVLSLLIDERFVRYPRLAEALKRDLAVIQQAKMKEVEGLLDRLLAAELNWVFVSEKDMILLQKEVEAGLSASGQQLHQQQQLQHVQQQLQDWPSISEEGTEFSSSSSANPLTAPLGARRTSGGLMGPAAAAAAAALAASSSASSSSSSSSLASPTVPVTRLLRPEGFNRELRTMQLSLDCYVRLLLRRTLYTIPMSVRNLLINEFRQDLVAAVAEKYNDEPRLRTLMLEEMWVNQKRQQEAERQAALEGVMRKMDMLS